MKVTFRVYNPSGIWLRTLDGKSTSQAWRNARVSTGRDKQEVALAIADLKAEGWRVKRHIDVSDAEEAIATVVTEQVIGEKKVSLIRMILNAIFGK